MPENHKRKILRLINSLALILLCFTACFEPYEFRIENEKPSLVVEGYISDVSFNESILYPSDGRFFSVKLRLTSDVINLKDEVAEGASVTLLSSSEEEWGYVESPSVPGTYVLYDKDFKACPDQEYKLSIVLADDKIYESAWEKMPEAVSETMGAIGFEEVEMPDYVVKAGERETEIIKGMNVNIALPENNFGKTVYYRWNFSPTWIYIAPLGHSSEPTYRCWAENENYLPDYTLQADHKGGYIKNLFFMRTVRNERIFERLSVLIKQYEMSEGFYNFWKEMKEQTESGGLSDIPPYNLRSNIVAVDGSEKVSGYFGVVNEKAVRWYFSKEKLSYYVDNVLKEDCERYEPHPECFNCLEYSRGKTTNIKPSWWE